MRKRKTQSDCDILLGNVEDVFGSLGACIDAGFDERKSKMDVAKGIFGFGKSLVKFGFNGTKCVVKKTPKALATVASVKREVTDTIVNEYQEYQKEVKQQELEERIRQLKRKNRKEVER